MEQVQSLGIESGPLKDLREPSLCLFKEWCRRHAGPRKREGQFLKREHAVRAKLLAQPTHPWLD